MNSTVLCTEQNDNKYNYEIAIISSNIILYFKQGIKNKNDSKKSWPYIEDMERIMSDKEAPATK